MKKLIKVEPKRGGLPSTRDRHVTARMPSTLIAEVEAWAIASDANRSDAFRQLVELGLARSKSAEPKPISAKSAERARQLAAKTIDGLVDAAASAEQMANRKRHLLKGPEEFRELRVDSGKETRSAGWSD